MWYIIILVSFSLGIFFSSRLICHKKTDKSVENNPSNSVYSPVNSNDTIKAMFSKEQINKKLKRLADTPRPTNLSYGAKCYSIAINNNDLQEYVCPHCGEKTIYKKNKENMHLFENVLSFDLEACRRQIEKIKGINISLDESQFCSQCTPKTENPTLCLNVNIAGQKDTAKVCNVSSIDIQLIQEFLSDELLHKGDREEEYPLVDYKGRIQKLLGIK